MDDLTAKMRPLVFLLKEKWEQSKQFKVIVTVSVIFLATFFILKVSDSTENKKMVIINNELDYKNSRLIKSSYGAIYKGKERLLESKLNKVIEQQQGLVENIQALKEHNKELQEKIESKSITLGNNPIKKNVDGTLKAPVIQTTEQLNENIRVHDSNFDYRSKSFSPSQLKNKNSNLRMVRTNRIVKSRSLISFPVKSKREIKKDEVVLPSGSYVKAKLMTGIEAPEGKTYR